MNTENKRKTMYAALALLTIWPVVHMVLIRQYDLAGHIRWCARRLDKVETGEIYRMIADGRGVFAQPAFMETFGLTVVEVQEEARKPFWKA